MNTMVIELPSGFAMSLPGAKVDVQVSRDRRTMNNMDSETKAIHIRLEEWGIWARDKGIRGYPSESPMEKAVLYGKLGIPQESNFRAEPEIPDRVAHIDVCVARCCQIDQRALKAYYEYHISMYELARNMSMRERQAQNVLRRARWRVSAHLAVMEG